MKDLKELLLMTQVSEMMSPIALISHPDILSLVEFCQQEKEDYKAVLQFARKQNSQRIVKNMIRLFKDTQRSPDNMYLERNNNGVSDLDFNRSLEEFNREVDRHFWSELEYKFKFKTYFSPRLYETLWLVKKDKYSHLEFNLENITPILTALEQMYSLENYQSIIQEYKHLFDFNFMKNGNLEIKVVYSDVHNRVKNEKELTQFLNRGFADLSFIAKGLLLTEGDWTNELLRESILTYDFDKDGMMAKEMDKHSMLKLNKKLAQKFSSITGITE